MSKRARLTEPVLFFGSFRCLPATGREARSDPVDARRRLAWVLRFVEGETLEGIAELLGCSVSTVQRRLRAAEARMGEIR